MNVDEAHTFRSIVVGSSNRRAVERMRCRRPTPVLLLGPTGVGKSHLLHAAANRHASRGERVLSLRGIEFQERYVACIYAGTVRELRGWLRAHDVLVVDELEDIMRYESAVEELARLVSDFIASGRRVYLATLKLWPALFDVLASWDADVIPVARPSLAQRSAVLVRRARRRLTREKLLAIARSSPTIPGVCAALERELLASAIGGASMARA